MNNLRWRWEETEDITSSYRNNTIHRNADDLFIEREKNIVTKNEENLALCW